MKFPIILSSTDLSFAELVRCFILIFINCVPFSHFLTYPWIKGVLLVSNHLFLKLGAFKIMRMFNDSIKNKAPHLVHYSFKYPSRDIRHLSIKFTVTSKNKLFLGLIGNLANEELQIKCHFLFILQLIYNYTKLIHQLFL